jgi:hypothetical protein
MATSAAGATSASGVVGAVAPTDEKELLLNFKRAIATLINGIEDLGKRNEVGKLRMICEELDFLAVATAGAYIMADKIDLFLETPIEVIKRRGGFIYNAIYQFMRNGGDAKPFMEAMVAEHVYFDVGRTLGNIEYPISEAEVRILISGLPTELVVNTTPSVGAQTDPPRMAVGVPLLETLTCGQLFVAALNVLMFVSKSKPNMLITKYLLDIIQNKKIFS